MADDFGCFEAAPRVLLGKGWPYRDDVTEAHVRGWLVEYAMAGMLTLWEQDGRWWGHLTGWARHQRNRSEYDPKNNPKGSKRKTPAPHATQGDLAGFSEGRQASGISREIPGDFPPGKVGFPGDFPPPQSQSQSQSQNYPPAPQGGASDPGGNDPPKRKARQRAAPKDYPEAFEAWWAVYPRKLDKGEAFKNWRSWVEREGASEADLLAAAKHYAASRVGEEARFTKHGASFLSLSAAPWRDWVKGPPEEPNAAPARFDPYEEFQRTGSARAPEDDAPQQRRASARWGLA